MQINPKYDGTFDIAIGRSRKETHWKNQEMTWSAFLKRISVTHRTAETFATYMAEKKTRQDEIKDVGGFVGGYVNNGRRKAENITHRQLVTLDIDFSKGQIWDDFTMLYDNAAAIYSTHKHTLENPRLRLILPLDRPVGTDEYVAIARRIAGDLDINCFDDTTYEPCRLMYWPSTSKDGEYVFEYQDGSWLSADKVLSSYHNWQDASEWPVSDRAGEVIQREIKKQGDPLEKPGVVGAFCRTYDIHEAIETFLDDVYDPCDIENRYTYKEGSTAAGLVTYDDKYAYSHHGTDPTSGKLCNAFDLVRLHLYGLQDEAAKEGTPGNKLPSYMAMLELASSDKAVKKTLASERSQNAKSDFEGSFSAEAEKEEDTDWQTMLEVNRKGECIGRITDFEIVLENHSLFKGKLRNNEFKNTWDIGNLPWKSLKPEWTNNDLNQLISWMEKFGMPANPNRISIAVSNVFNNHSYHPVRDYLNSLSWDGEPRVETLFIEYLGAEDTIYTRTVTRKSLVAAVARVFEPGIQFDSVIILVGRQGLGKSTILKKLGKDWFSDNFRSVRDKVSIEQIQGVWIMEISELAGLKKQEVEDVKNYISIRIDRGRMAYGRHVEAFPRQCIFFGSTNHDDFLADPTGNRRFWPIKAEVQSPSKSVFKDFTTYEIDQVWAEAYKLYQKNESLALDKEIARMAQEIQKAHSEIDEKAGLIQDYIDTPLPENWAEMDIIDRRNYLRGDPIQEKGTMVRTRVSIMEIWCECFGKNSPDITKYNSKELNNIMKNTEGWKVAPGGPKRVKNYGMQRCYDRIKVENKSLTRMKALSINHLN